MEQTQTPRTALLLAKAHSFITLLQARNLTFVEGSALRRAINNADKDGAAPDFSDRDVPQIAERDEDEVWRAVIALTHADLMYCCDPDELLDYKLT